MWTLCGHPGCLNPKNVSSCKGLSGCEYLLDTQEVRSSSLPGPTKKPPHSRGFLIALEEAIVGYRPTMRWSGPLFAGLDEEHLELALPLHFQLPARDEGEAWLVLDQVVGCLTDIDFSLLP